MNIKEPILECDSRADSYTRKSVGDKPGLTFSITDQEFNLIRSFVYDSVGINLTEQKRSLVVGRLQKKLRQLGLKCFKDYYDYVSGDKTGQASVELADLISTNYTYFNREKAHFEYFINTALPETARRIMSRGKREIRVWCAAASSGEEPYLLAMLMREYFGEEYRLWDGGLLATDISKEALLNAEAGVYKDEAVKPVPADIRRKYFERTGNSEWKITVSVKKDVTFRRLNLMNRHFPFKKPFHIIFCRNVMIYFDQKTRDALVRRFYDVTEPDGYLFIGHSETLNRSNMKYKYIKPAIYRKV